MLNMCLVLSLASFVTGDPPTPLDIVSALETVTIDAITKAQPSVVAIARVRNEDLSKTTAIKGFAPTTIERGPDGKPIVPFNYAAPGDFSSGVVIGEGGEILTTYHTLVGSSQIWCVGSDKLNFEAEILAADPRSDLAVIAPRASSEFQKPKLTPIKLGDAGKMRPGTFLVALGNPYNAARDGKASAGWGILANTTRRIHAPLIEEGGARGKFFRYQPTLLQLDAKLNLGMSGGAVVNMKGELVGLTTAAASPVAYDVQAGYAIPLDELGHRIVNLLRQGKEVEYGFLGIGLDEKDHNTVSSVAPGSPADRADLVVRDVIVAVDGHELDPDDGLTMALALIPVGENVKLKILRAGDPQEKTIFVSKYPVVGKVIATNRPKPWRGLRVDYTSILAGNPMMEFTLANVMSQGGVCVTEVESGSPVNNAGLKNFQIITQVDGINVTTPAAFADAVSKKEGKDVALTIQNGSGGTIRTVIHK